MSVNGDALAAIGRDRRHTDARVAAVERELARRWRAGWATVAPAWEATVAAVLDAATDGAWPTQAEILALSRAAAGLQAVQDTLDALAVTVPDVVRAELDALTRAAVETQARVVGAQYPPGARVAFDRVDADALGWIVARTVGQVESLTRPLPGWVQDIMKRTLFQGVAVGLNPRRAAALMIAQAKAGFVGGLRRATVIARTEMLDAHRAAAAAQQDRMTNVLAGWQWIASLDTRTCGACLVMHGSIHPLSEPGPIDHQQGRCARMPVVKPWRELGFDAPEPESLVPDGRGWFDGLPQAERVRILGAEQVGLLDAGRIGWSDLATRRSNPGWRDSIVPTSLKDLRALAR